MTVTGRVVTELGREFGGETDGEALRIIRTGVLLVNEGEWERGKDYILTTHRLPTLKHKPPRSSIGQRRSLGSGVGGKTGRTA